MNVRSESFSTRTARRSYWSPMVLLTAVIWSCALPSEEEAGKTRCVTSADCPSPLECNDGRCGMGGLTDAGQLDAASTDTSMVDAGGNIPCPIQGCEAGRRCHNGFCRLECDEMTTCPAGEGCQRGSGLCADLQPDLCPAVACQGSQICRDGYCGDAVEVAQPCEDPAYVDGCPPNSICDEAAQQSACRSFPHCPPSGDCPPGAFGSVCISDLIPEKEPMCVPKACASAANCPSDWACVPLGGISVCTNGEPGSACSLDAHCESGDCRNLLFVCR